MATTVQNCIPCAYPFTCASEILRANAALRHFVSLCSQGFILDIHVIKLLQPQSQVQSKIVPAHTIVYFKFENNNNDM